MLEIARRQLDNRLQMIRALINYDQPPNGWLRSVREALGVTRRQLATRLGVTARTIEAIETSEARGTVTLQSLKRLAEGLNCKVHYAIIPDKSLQEMVDEQMLKKARSIVEGLNHTMSLEEQSTDADALLEQIRMIVDDMKRRKNISFIWEELE